MAKIARLITVDYEVWNAAKASGFNISEVCESALMSIVGTKQRFLNSIFEGDANNDRLNEMVNKIIEKPHTSTFWSRFIREEYGYNATRFEVLKLVEELVGDV